MTMQINNSPSLLWDFQKLRKNKRPSVIRHTLKITDHLDYPWELPNGFTEGSLKESYRLLIENVMGTSPYIIVTVNLTTKQIRRALAATVRRSRKSHKNKSLALGQEYLEARCSGVSAVDAMEALWSKFIKRLNVEALGTHRHKRRGEYLRWVRVYENHGKRYKRSPPNHLHMLLEIPGDQSPAEFESLFRRLFSWLVYPVSQGVGSLTEILSAKKQRVLDIRLGRSVDECSHPNYVQKQLINWETASDRLFFSGSA